MRDTKQEYPFSADRPITSRSKDLLNRSAFAESLASAIKGWTGNDSLVIALYGSWGSGKTSVKNMALESLRESKGDCPLVVEFNPWQWAGQHQVAEAFFHEIGLQLGKDVTGKEAKQRAAKWEAYAASWKAGASLAASLRRIIVWFPMILGLLGLGGLLAAPSWVKLGMIVLCISGFVLAAVFGFSATVAENVAAFLASLVQARQKPLPDVKKELAELLRKLTKPVLVVIDDLDRLTKEELKLLVQLIKANADFPSLVYLLLFQRDVVEKNLEYAEAINGRE